MDVNGNKNSCWNDVSGFSNGDSSVNNNLQQTFYDSELPMNEWDLNCGTVTMNIFDNFLNDHYNSLYMRDNDFVNNNFVEESENHLTPSNFVQGYGNAQIGYNYPNQMSPYQNYYENHGHQNHEALNSNLSNQTNFISLQDNCFSGQFENEMQQQKQQSSHNQISSPPQQYPENGSYFQCQNSYNSENSTISSISSNCEVDETSFRSGSEDSEDCSSSDSMPSINGKKKRGRKPLYKTEKEIKEARNDAQKRYAKKQKETLKDLKIEVPSLEAENFKLEKQKQSLIKICRKMLFHPDLPKLEQSVVGAIIGFS